MILFRLTFIFFLISSCQSSTPTTQLVQPSNECRDAISDIDLQLKNYATKQLKWLLLNKFISSQDIPYFEAISSNHNKDEIRRVIFVNIAKDCVQKSNWQLINSNMNLVSDGCNFLSVADAYLVGQRILAVDFIEFGCSGDSVKNIFYYFNTKGQLLATKQLISTFHVATKSGDPFPGISIDDFLNFGGTSKVLNKKHKITDLDGKLINTNIISYPDYELPSYINVNDLSFYNLINLSKGADNEIKK